MDGMITGETDDVIGLSVLDNDEVEHLIEMDFTGTITGHQQDGYPDDPDKRTTRQDEMVSQARKYAKWYVYQNTEYDTLPPRKNPDRIAATAMTLHELSEAEFEEYFGTFYQQGRSHFDDSIERPVELVAMAQRRENVHYMQNVYLAAGIDDLRGAHEEFGERLGEVTANVLKEINAGIVESTLETLFDTVEAEARKRDLDLPSYDIEGVSDLYYQYYDETRSRETVYRDDPFEREPDTRIELMQQPVDSIEAFRAVVLQHLMCQIRDCYVGMGEEPPAPYRVLGPGFHHYTGKYQNFSMYPRYDDPGASIRGYSG